MFVHLWKSLSKAYTDSNTTVKGEGGGGRCEDLDECGEDPDRCGPGGRCSNLPGSFDCDCERGFAFDNETCADVNECLAEGGNPWEAIQWTFWTLANFLGTFLGALCELAGG